MLVAVAVGVQATGVAVGVTTETQGVAVNVGVGVAVARLTPRPVTEIGFVGTLFSRPSDQRLRWATVKALFGTVIGPTVKLAFAPAARSPRLTFDVITTPPVLLYTTRQTDGDDSVAVSLFVSLPVTVSDVALRVDATLVIVELPLIVLPTMNGDPKSSDPIAFVVTLADCELVTEKKSEPPFCHDRRQPEHAGA